MTQNVQSEVLIPAISSRTLGHTFLAASVVFGVSAQLLLKFAMLQVNAHPHLWYSYSWVLFGLLVYAVGTGFWMLCLGFLDLSYAYPFTGLSYVLVLGASWLLFEDMISGARIAGVLLICLGVTLIPSGPRRNS